MALRINERLNLVVPLYGDNDQIYAYVHSSPISREVFEANFLLISKTFAAIHGEGLGEIAGPRVAAMLMRETAKRMTPRGEASIELPLLDEIRRLSNVVMPGLSGWTTMPLHDAIAGRLIDSDDVAEVENALVFFTSMSAMHRKQVIAEILPGAARLWGAQTTSSDCMAFVASLPTSIPGANTGEKSDAPHPAPPTQSATLTTTDPAGNVVASSLPS